MTRRVNTGAHLWPGLILIGLGTLFLLDNLDLIEFRYFVEIWWPSALILVGAWKILTDSSRRWGGPLLLIALGFLFQIDRLHVFPWWKTRNLWPVLLIVLGIWMLFARLRSSPPQAAGTEGAGNEPRESRLNRSENDGGVLNAFVFWGGMENAPTSKEFRGGEATAVMGAMELDLRQARLAPGTNRLKLTAILGGIGLRVPAEWDVELEGTPLLGKIEDSRKFAVPPSSTDFSVTSARLVVSALAMMGGIEVKT